MDAFLANLGTNIPQILRYYVPGFVFYYIISKSFCEPEDSEIKYIVRIVISWVIMSIISLVITTPFIFMNLLYSQFIAAIVLAAVLGFLFMILINALEPFGNVVSRFLGYANGSVLSQLIYKKNLVAKVTMKCNDFEHPLIIIGTFHTHDHHPNPSCISLGNYTINGKENNDDYILIPLCEVQYLEVEKPKPKEKE